MTAEELEAALVAQFGPDFRDKVIVSAVASFNLRDAFAECGLQDPARPFTSSHGWGVWQMSSSK